MSKGGVSGEPVRKKASKRLPFAKRLAIWAGIMSIIGTTAALYNIFIRDQPSPTASTINAKGDGTCIVYGGSGNVCYAAAQKSAVENPFTAAAITWSAGWFQEAAIGSSPTPEAFFGAKKPHQSIQRGTLLKSGGAVFGKGILMADLATSDGSVAHVVDVEPLFFTVKPSREAAWVYYEHPAGGGPEEDRVFSLHLDKRVLVDEGVGGVPGAVPADATAEPLRHAFTVSRDKPVRIKIYASTCEAFYYEWGIRITYTVRGTSFTQDIGSTAVPFRSVGMLPQPVPYYDQLPGEPHPAPTTISMPSSCMPTEDS